jgi:DNA-binding SARP family transcriptional activator/TolB-like protein
MIEFRALGSAGLVRADGHPVASVLAQPKRLALLLYLTIAAPRGFHRRDTLLGLFWPESDTERARGALRQAVRFLRRSLGEAVLVNRGEDEIGVADGIIRCDVVAFDTAVEAGDHAGALAAYRGDLLEGFFIDGVPEWERWLDGERLRLRRRAASCAARLADDAAARGDWTEAVAFARRGCELAPDDENALGRLLTCLAGCGDRAGAIAEYDRYAARLAADMQLAPLPATQALIDRLRDPATTTPPAKEVAPATVARPATAATLATMATPRVAAPATLATPATPEGAAAPTVAQRMSRDRVIAAGLAALLLLGAAAWAAWPPKAAPALHANRFLVVPFENLTGDSTLNPVGPMAADRISQGLAGVGDIEVVPMLSVLASARHLEMDAGDLGRADAMTALAREVGAGRLVSGSYYLQGGRLLFQARITNVDGGGMLRAIDVVDAATDSPQVAVELLRTRIRAALAPMVDDASHARAGSAPPTYEAYRGYVAGMEAFVRRDVRAALRHMELAAEADSIWAMPLIVTAIMHMNLGDWAAADSVARRVGPLRDGLGPLELAIHDMISAWVRGDDAAAYDAVVRQTQLAPGTIAHYQIAEQARRLNRPREAIRVLRELAPGGEPTGELRGWRTYWRELAWSHHMLGEHRAELRAARRARKLYPQDSEILLHEARALAALGRVDEMERLVQQRLASPATDQPSAGLMLRTLGHELIAHGRTDTGSRMLERSADWYASRPPADRRAFRFALAATLYDAERLEESREIFLELAAESPDHMVVRAYLGLIAARTGDREQAVQTATWLRELDRPYLFGQHTLWRARIAARLGNPADAARLIREALAEGHTYTPALHIDPDLRAIHPHPAFGQILNPDG